MRSLAIAALGLAIGVGAFSLGAGQGAAPDPDDWATYVRRFVTMDGRVVDSGNRGISHSEGQGYAMLLAVANRDPETFAQLWRWTRQHLQIRGDHLFVGPVRRRSNRRSQHRRRWRHPDRLGAGARRAAVGRAGPSRGRPRDRRRRARAARDP